MKPTHPRQRLLATMSRGIAASIALALGALVVLGLASAPAALAEDQGAQPEAEEIGMLFVQTANRGTLQKVAGRPVFKLKLHGVSRQVVWFQERPGRGSGHIPIRGFVGAWAGFGFSEARPNAALTLLDGKRGADTAVFKLSEPRYRTKRRTIRYFARPLSEAGGNLSHFQSRRAPRLPRRFQAASLFIDNANGRVVGGCLIEPFTQCPGANLFGARLTDADLRGADLSRADLADATLHGANLHGASLWKADLISADLTGADLTEADLRWAYLYYADLTDADLTGANLNFVYFCRTTMPGGWENNSYCP